jgi:8-oxo-dGTP diphosphatase
MLKATLCHIRESNKILLQQKSAGRFGEGKWNAVGGKLVQGEIPVDGAVREAYEETGLRVQNLQYHGKLKFYFGQGLKPDWIVYVFATFFFKGSINPSEEGILKWFYVNKIPYQQMWEDDIHWLPHMLKGERFRGVFRYGKNSDRLIKHKLEIL